MEKLILDTNRSPCPIACSLDLIGDRWTMLVIRDLFFGATRFKDFTASPEGIPTNILTERLNRLLEYGIIQSVPLPPSGKRRGYELTERGRELLPIVRSVREWGLKHIEGTRLPPSLSQ